MRREHELDRPLEQRPDSVDDLLPGDAPAQPLVQREARSEVGERVKEQQALAVVDHVGSPVPWLSRRAGGLWLVGFVTHASLNLTSS
jgi:hypothetical protein